MLNAGKSHRCVSNDTTSEHTNSAEKVGEAGNGSEGRNGDGDFSPETVIKVQSALTNLTGNVLIHTMENNTSAKGKVTAAKVICLLESVITADFVSCFKL